MADGGLPDGSIDTPEPGSVVERGTVLATGWALGPDGPLDDRLLLTVDDRRGSGVRRSFSPIEVALKHSEVPDAGFGGWDALVDLRGVRGPTVALGLQARRADGELVELGRTELRVEPFPRPPGSRAVFTIVQNEPVFLPLWLRHYSRHFEPTDIYVLDHDSGDGSTDGLEGACNVVRVHRDRSFDHAWLKGVVEDFQAFLLRSYDAVLFAEADEFVVPDPAAYGGLGAYIDRLDGVAACCTGFNVVHYPDEEEPLRFDQPILAQRGYWHAAERWYSKRLLSRAPLSWHFGFHDELNAPWVEPDPELFLVHLHRADYEYCLARHKGVAERRWYEKDLERDLGRHYRAVEADEFREWFFGGYDLEGTDREPIPDRLKQAL